MFDQLTDVRALTPGGQKEVFYGRHPEFGEVVYKKIFPGSDADERTRREIRAAELLNDQNFVPSILAHNCDDEAPEYRWILEQYVEGENLRSVLNSGRRFVIGDIIRFLETMLSIIVRSEGEHIVHRDIKPENIILDTNENFWLLDFGIARHLTLESITDSNQNFGICTLGYASSEQFRNLKKQIDNRADLFSIGVVSYEMITGVNFYIQDIDQDIMRMLKKLESISLPPLRIEGDTRFLLSAFIGMLGDHRRNRRPRTAHEAKLVFESILDTLNTT